MSIENLTTKEIKAGLSRNVVCTILMVWVIILSSYLEWWCMLAIGGFGFALGVASIGVGVWLLKQKRRIQELEQADE